MINCYLALNFIFNTFTLRRTKLHAKIYICFQVISDSDSSGSQDSDGSGDEEDQEDEEELEDGDEGEEASNKCHLTNIFSL